MDCSLPVSSVHGISQVRILEWVAILFSRGSSQPKDQTHVSRTAGRLYHLSHQGSHYIYQIKVEETQSIFTVCYRFILRNEPFPGTCRLSLILWFSQLSPNLLAQGTSFMGDNFSMDQGWGGWFGDNSRALHLLCNFFLLSFHQVHLGLSGILKVGNPWSSPVVLNPWGLLCPQEMFASVCSQFWLSWLGLEGEAGDVRLSRDV